MSRKTERIKIWSAGIFSFILTRIFAVIQCCDLPLLSLLAFAKASI